MTKLYHFIYNVDKKTWSNWYGSVKKEKKVKKKNENRHNKEITTTLSVLRFV